MSTIHPNEQYCHCLLQEGAKLPLSTTLGAAGYDLYTPSGVSMAPGERVVVPTGVHMEIPRGYFGKIEGRSSLALRHGIITAGGIIDSDYRGEIKVILINLGKEKFLIENGNRIAQMVVCPVTQVKMEEVDELSETSRGAGGFGSTGIK